MKRARLEGADGSVAGVSAVSLESQTGSFVDLESMAKDRSNLGESGERNVSLDAVDEKDNDEDDDGIKDVPQTAGSGAQRLGRSSSTISPVDGVSSPV